PAACHDRSVVGQQHGPPGGFGVDPDRAAASSLDPFAGQLALEALDAPGLDSDPARLGPGGELLASLRQHAASVGVRLVGASALAAITLLPLLESPPALRHPPPHPVPLGLQALHLTEELLVGSLPLLRCHRIRAVPDL